MLKKLKKLLKRLKFVYRPAEKSTKRKLLGIIGLSLVAILVISLTAGAILRHYDSMVDQARELENQNNELKNDINNKDSVEGVIDYAEDELGMVPTDATVVVPK